MIFDVGHGRGSFSFTTARHALAQGLSPGTISSDLHVYNVAGPVFDLATTMSKLLALGLPLGEIVRMTTAAPAHALGDADRIGTLRPGAAADVTLLRIESGSFTLHGLPRRIHGGRGSARSRARGARRRGPCRGVRAGRACLTPPAGRAASGADALLAGPSPARYPDSRDRVIPAGERRGDRTPVGRYWLGIDIGATFTDFYALRQGDRRRHRPEGRVDPRG